MFQNITDDFREEQEYEQVQESRTKKKRIGRIGQIFTKQNIALYVIAFMISSVGFGSSMIPFGIAFLAACCSNAIPIGVIYVLTCIGTFIGFGTSSLLTYILTTLVFFALMLMLKPKFDENYNRKLGLQVGLACFIVQAGRMFFGSFLVYELLASCAFAVLAGVFYKIFTGSIPVIRDFGIKKVFSVEEVIGASLIVAIAIAGFRDISILGFSIKNILSILLVLIMGWKNGMLVGATTGVTIGVVLGIIGNSDPIQVAAYALSGLIAGILNKLGKIGVIGGFILGTGIVTYVTNGNSYPFIMIQEILIASLGLLAIPKSVYIDIEDLFGKTKCLPKAAEHSIEQKQEAIYKLNSVSEAISEVAESYEQAAATVVEDTKETERNKKIFIEEFKKNILNLEENILYEELIEEDNELLDDIFAQLLEKEIIESKDLLAIFADHNNYIMGFDDTEIANKIENDISAMIKAMNYSFRVSKIHFIWEKKIDENRKTMKSQLDGISKAIATIADEMQEKEVAQEEKEKQQKEEMKAILNQKGMDVKDISIVIEPSGRMQVTAYLDSCRGETLQVCKADRIGEILSKIIGQKVVLQKNRCPLKEQREVCHLTYATEDLYTIQIGIARATKKGSPVSGDSILQAKLEDGKYLLAISDGMGSGPEARKSSKIATKMLERLLTSGFEKEVSIDLINSSINLNSNEDTYATLDIAIVDLYKGNIEFIKNGACPTFIKNRKQVDVIKTISLPAGILDNIDLTVYDRDITSNDMMVMCSDGIVESNAEYENKELWVKYLLEEIQTDNVQKIADILLNESIDNVFGIPKDDMTVIVTKFIKKEKYKHL